VGLSENLVGKGLALCIAQLMLPPAAAAAAAVGDWGGAAAPEAWKVARVAPCKLNCGV
jgi:hypothetical protein